MAITAILSSFRIFLCFDNFHILLQTINWKKKKTRFSNTNATNGKMKQPLPTFLVILSNLLKRPRAASEIIRKEIIRVNASDAKI